MPRSVNSVASRARRKKILKQAKGYFGRRKNVYTVAKNAVEKGMLYSYRDRKNKKRTFRALWIQRINAGARQYGMSYSQFMGKVKANNIELNRKVLADLAMNNPEAFKAIVDTNSLVTLLFLRINLKIRNALNNSNRTIKITKTCRPTFFFLFTTSASLIKLLFERFSDFYMLNLSTAQIKKRSKSPQVVHLHLNLIHAQHSAQY